MSPAAGADALRALVAEELARPAAPGVAELAALLAVEGGAATAAVLFYGSALRGGDPTEGVLDFYVLLDRLQAWPGGPLRALAGRLLPPNVEYHERTVGGRTLRAKVALLSAAQWRRLTRGDGLDFSVWARFAQPAGLAWARDEDARAMAMDGVAQAVAAAAGWAAVLAPEGASPDAAWSALFARTYAAELRVERGGRERAILAFDGPRWARALQLGWAVRGVAPTGLDAAVQARGRRRWAWRARLAKPLNVLRLAKATFTFTGAARYAAWKIERHTGVRVALTPWMERHPLLAAPGVLWRLRRAGVLR